MVFGVVTVAAEAAFCYLGSERLPAVSTICLFCCLACVWRFVCRLSFASKHFSAVHSIVIREIKFDVAWSYVKRQR